MERQNEGHEELIRSQQRQIDKLSELSRTQEQKIRDLHARIAQIQEHT